MKMKLRNVIANFSNLAKVIQKEIPVPFALRRAIRKNYNTLKEECLLFEDERKILKIQCEGEELQAKIEEMLDTEVNVEIAKVSETMLDIDGLTVTDEMALEFMIEEVQECQ